MTACCEADLSFPLRRTAPQSTTEPQDTVAGKRFHEHRNHALQPGMVVRHDWAAAGLVPGGARVESRTRACAFFLRVRTDGGW